MEEKSGTIVVVPACDRPLACTIREPRGCQAHVLACISSSADRKKDDGMLRHPSDGQQWKDFDKAYPEFGKEPRNVRLALSTDGMNPFGELSSSHSTWPVVLTVYNLPSHLCQRRRYLMLTMLISGPKQPTDIDVFQEPLMEEM